MDEIPRSRTFAVRTVILPALWGALGFGLAGAILVAFYPSRYDFLVINQALVDGQTGFALLYLVMLVALSLSVAATSGATETAMLGRALGDRWSTWKLILVGAGASVLTWIASIVINAAVQLDPVSPVLLWGFLNGVTIGALLGRTRSWPQGLLAPLAGASGLGVATAALRGIKYELDEPSVMLGLAVVVLWAAAGALLGMALSWQVADSGVRAVGPTDRGGRDG
jgi:hypothetical protein